MFNLANLFTASNLICGILAIVFALSGRLDLAPIAIFCGLIFDFLDGFIARLMKSSGELGKQLDSFADMITFGVAPGVIMMVVLTVQPGTFESGISIGQIHENYLRWFNSIDLTTFSGNYIPLIGLLLPFFAMFRLAKFNIDLRQSESFIGLPTPSMTLFFMVFPLALVYNLSWNEYSILLFNPWLILCLIVVFGLLMVSEIPLFSLKVKSFGWQGNQIRIVFLLISLGLILAFRLWSIALIVFLYLILSMIENIFSKTKSNEI
ncbi:MAG: CDP-alcohol phosphatidyltransferase family protein [Crocinitomicaceae bacterium]